MTDERHSIWLDAPSWFCRPNSTDWQMKLSFVREFSDLQASIVDSWFFNLVYSALYVSIHFLSGRVYEWFTHVCACLRAWVLKRRGAEIVISQGLEPPLPKGAKVIWETFFLDQTPGESDPEFRRGGSNMWIRAVERFGGRVDVIGVRGTASVNLLRRMFPEYAGKVHDLNYVHPEYELLTDDGIRRKQEAPGPVRILFIGRAARRKGLLPLLEALSKLRDEGLRDFSLTVVSDCVDGKIEFPDWVDHKVSVPHEEAMRLMQSAQVFVMPSFVESYGLVYLESLASGCVTVVPDQDPQREFVDSGRAGLVVDPRDVYEMVEKLRPILQDQDLRVRLSVAGRHHYEAALSQRVVRAKWRQAIQSLG